MQRERRFERANLPSETENTNFPRGISRITHSSVQETPKRNPALRYTIAETSRTTTNIRSLMYEYDKDPAVYVSGNIQGGCRCGDLMTRRSAALLQEAERASTNSL